MTFKFKKYNKALGRLRWIHTSALSHAVILDFEEVHGRPRETDTEIVNHYIDYNRALFTRSKNVADYFRRIDILIDAYDRSCGVEV